MSAATAGPKRRIAGPRRKSVKRSGAVVPGSPQNPYSEVVSLRVRDLHVNFELLSDRRDALRRKFVRRATGPGRLVVRAVQGVTFDLFEGDAVGIVGSNGSGKSTLMSAMAGLLPPTSGEILTTSEPKLLGVGAALLPAATGHRNIRIGLLALGATPAEVAELAPTIAEFTELGDALDRPLRTYSSGMRARLLFGISTSIRPKILLVDEALAVGDRQFKDKSRARIEDMLAQSGTLVLVSHNMREIRAICNRAIWLEQGRILADGPVDEVLDAYGDTD
jgi:teichoic acid transport system ATP-binding protein